MVHASKLIEFEVQGSCGSWLEARGSCRAMGSYAGGSWGSVFLSGSVLGDLGLVGFGIQGSCGACFKAHRVRGSRLVWFMALGSGFISGYGLVRWLVGLGVRVGLGARRFGARGVRDSRLVWHASRLMEFDGLICLLNYLIAFVE